MEHRPIRLGLLAAARITSAAVVDPARAVDGISVTALAARSLGRAEETAARWGVATAYGSYEELVDDPDVDAVYIATPAALHRRWTLAALEAGKDVLCEKPLAANATEAREMVEAAEAAGRILMEAFHWRYHPIVAQTESILATGRIGALRHVHGVFDLPEGHIAHGDIRWELALGGGALMDLGCYPAQWLRWVVGSEPRVTSAEAVCPVPDVDGRMVAQLAWDDGTTGTIQCSMIETGPVEIRLEIVGADAILHVANPLAPQHGARIEVREPDGRVDELAVDGLDTTTYQHQLAAFVEAVTSRVPPITSGHDSIATMELIDACYTAAGLAPRPSYAS
jgi:predicted dehydrogenase